MRGKIYTKVYPKWKSGKKKINASKKPKPISRKRSTNTTKKGMSARGWSLVDGPSWYWTNYPD